MNNKIFKLTQRIKIDKILNKNIKDITSSALKNIDSWELLENRYKKLQEKGKKNNIFYKKRIKYFELKLENSLSSLMLILMNLKNIS